MLLTIFFICLAFTCGYILCGLFKQKRLDLFINLIGDNDEEINETFIELKKLFNEYDEVNSKICLYRTDEEDEI